MKIKTKRGFWQNLSDQMKTLLGSALGFVAALAWNDAIQTFIKKILPLESASSIILKFLYAVIVTAIAVILIFYLSRFENLVKKSSKK